MAFTLNNVVDDVITEILSHLPIQSVLRCRCVCKFWRDVIDSSFLKKLHFEKLGDKKEDEVLYLKFYFGRSYPILVGIDFLDNGKELMSSYDVYADVDYALRGVGYVAGPARGLVCFNSPVSVLLKTPSIAVCNPCLGQVKILPLSPILSRVNAADEGGHWRIILSRLKAAEEGGQCRIITRHIGIGFDEDYKVVELLDCKVHDRHHAQVYSRRTNSWRELARDVAEEKLRITDTIQSWSNDGNFVHWLGVRKSSRAYVLVTFDVKNESFRTLTMPTYRSILGSPVILANDDGNSFLLFRLPCRYFFSDTKFVEIYESRCEGDDNILTWNLVINNQKLPPCGMSLPDSDWRMIRNRGCVVIMFYFPGKKMLGFYDYRAREFVACLNDNSKSSVILGRYILEYRGSLLEC